MYEEFEALEELCKTATKELKTANEKVRSAGGKLSQGDVAYLDQLTHMIKSIKTTLAMMEAEERGSYGNGSYNDGYDGGSGRYVSDGAYARGRGRGARRDSMGRYAEGSRPYGDRSYDDRSYDDMRR